MPKGYTSKPALENYTLQTIETNFAEQIAAWIASVETFIERYTGRVFIADSPDSGGDYESRLYDGNHGREILIDDCTAVGTLKIDGNEIAADQYLIYPANTECKYKLRLKTNIFRQGHQNVEVAAAWGYSDECPADITLAATILVAGIINYGNDAKGKVRSESVGRYSVTYSDEKGWQDFNQALKILNSYRKTL